MRCARRNLDNARLENTNLITLHKEFCNTCQFESVVDHDYGLACCSLDDGSGKPSCGRATITSSCKRTVATTAQGAYHFRNSLQRSATVAATGNMSGCELLDLRQVDRRGEKRAPPKAPEGKIISESVSDKKIPKSTLILKD